jgi:hypothetical protein
MRRDRPNRSSAGASSRLAAASLVLGLAGGCAFDIAQVKHAPAVLATGTKEPAAFTLAQRVDLDIGLGYRRQLREGSTWSYVGTVGAGEVYRSRDQVLTLEASNIHEAWLVVSGGRLVGYYLPVEKAYAPAVEVVTLPLR